ncbi:MAG: excinuclease ABC subunit UvrA, partial [Verrucomicrobiae bacterium]|nr:excinuclease ABC subunit UvrA [Verrucomicrobiae bacterium]
MKRADVIEIVGARQHNLKGISLRLPLHRLIVVTGVSGSGKSSLAFDTLYAEGQRRYVETFSPYARQFLDRMDRPRVDRLDGIPPAIAIDQTNPVKTSRSTVGTMTELNDHLKLLFARAARLFCRQCGRPVQRDNPQTIYRQLAHHTGPIEIRFPVEIPHNFSREEVVSLLARQGYTQIIREHDNRLEVLQDRVENTPRNRARIIEGLEAALRIGRGRVWVNDQPFSADLHCAVCDLHYRDPQPNLFSFNSPIGACETCRGFGRVIGIDYDLVIPDPTKSLADGAVKPWQTASYRECQDDLLAFAAKRGIPTDVPWRDLAPEQQRWVIEGEGRWEDGKWYGVQRFFDWLETKAYKMHVRVLLARYRSYRLCQACGGARLKPDALLWRLPPNAIFPNEPGPHIYDLQKLPLRDTAQYFAQLQLPPPLDAATELLLREIRTRLQYLVEVGLDYLTLDRQSRTLSGGEVQRVNLTTALGASLVNTLFVLDEPSIGLHPRDTARLIRILHRLRDAGNSLLVVEHDPDIIRAADLILDLGPGPGEHGGRVVCFGSLKKLLRCRQSLTAQYLRGDRAVSAREPRPPGTQWLRVRGATEHNLKNLDVDIPLNRLVCVTGVSGSGKSTLVEDVLYRALCRLKGKLTEPPGAYRAIEGHETIADVILVDQSPIGRTTRSNPASYVGAFDEIRRLFAQQPLARQRGYSAGTFSFNSGNGRCPTCAGNGFLHIEMQFLSDVYLRCSDCNGQRYRPEILEVTLRGRSIADVLELTADEATEFFAESPEITRRLQPLRDVGLGYLRLGQPVPTLSG